MIESNDMEVEMGEAGKLARVIAFLSAVVLAIYGFSPPL